MFPKQKASLSFRRAGDASATRAGDGVKLQIFGDLNLTNGPKSICNQRSV